MKKKILVVNLRYTSAGPGDNSGKVMSAFDNDERCHSELFECGDCEKIATLIDQIKKVSYDVILIVWDCAFSEKEVWKFIATIRQEVPKQKMVAVSSLSTNRQLMLEAGCIDQLHSFCRPEIIGMVVCKNILDLPINRNTIDAVVALLTSSVNELELRTRPANGLYRGNFKHVWQVCVLPSKTLQKIEGMGVKSVAEIQGMCCLYLFCNQEFLLLLQKAFWKWTETIGYKSETTPEQQLQMVQLLLQWPTLRKSVEEILSQKP